MHASAFLEDQHFVEFLYWVGMQNVRKEME